MHPHKLQSFWPIGVWEEYFWSFVLNLFLCKNSTPYCGPMYLLIKDHDLKNTNKFSLTFNVFPFEKRCGPLYGVDSEWLPWPFLIHDNRVLVYLCKATFRSHWNLEKVLFWWWMISNLKISSNYCVQKNVYSNFWIMVYIFKLFFLHLLTSLIM